MHIVHTFFGIQPALTGAGESGDLSERILLMFVEGRDSRRVFPWLNMDQDLPEERPVFLRYMHVVFAIGGDWNMDCIFPFSWECHHPK